MKTYAYIYIYTASLFVCKPHIQHHTTVIIKRRIKKNDKLKPNANKRQLWEEIIEIKIYSIALSVPPAVISELMPGTS